jgi:predicted Zn-dependent peptidase
MLDDKLQSDHQNVVVNRIAPIKVKMFLLFQGETSRQSSEHSDKRRLANEVYISSGDRTV